MISGSGDAETICLNAGEYMISEIVSTGDQIVELFQNLYDVSGDDVNMYYRTGATPVACFGAAWIAYAVPFVSSGYVQIKLVSTLGGGPLEASGSGRYLVDSAGNPFLMIGDSPQGMISDLTPAQMETYMADREARGINFIQVHLISGTTFGGANNTTFPAQDGTTPFTTTGDITTPRAAYFDQVVDMIELAASHRMNVCLTVAEYINAKDLFKNATLAECEDFGAYVANYLKHLPNIVWDFGNDFHWIDDTDGNDSFLAVCDGVISADNTHLITSWMGNTFPDTAELSRDSTDWNSRITLDLAYLYVACYDRLLDSYAMNPAKPVHMGEANYEGESLNGYTTTPYVLRKQHYWSMLSGACGVVYCNGPDTYKFNTGWDTRLSTTGVNELAYLIDLLTAYSWWLLVPDYPGHDVLTAGYGTYNATGSIETNDYATCAWITDGSLAMIYMPTNRTMTVDMSQFSGTVTCRWFDPTSGQYEADPASPLSNSGTHDFSHSGANDAGAADWVLVLET